MRLNDYFISITLTMYGNNIILKMEVCIICRKLAKITGKETLRVAHNLGVFCWVIHINRLNLLPIGNVLDNKVLSTILTKRISTDKGGRYAKIHWSFGFYLVHRSKHTICN